MLGASSGNGNAAVTRPVHPQRVDLWHVPLQQYRRRIDEVCRMLAPSEMRSVRDMVEPHRSRRLLARTSLRLVLSEYVGLPPPDLQFVYGSWGKPALKVSAVTQGLEFNLSTSNDCCLIAVTRVGPVGVDIEAVVPVPEARKLARRYFAPDEAAVLEMESHGGSVQPFFRYWTAKEAYAKALGRGLSIPLGKYRIPEQFLHQNSAVVTDLDGGRLMLIRVDPESEVIGSLAVRIRAGRPTLLKRSLDSELAERWISNRSC
jgi:4'-phosphopantetheinyl transferase